MIVTAAYIVGFVWRHSPIDNDSVVGIGQIVLSAISLGALTISGALGGKLAYHYGVRVADEATQAGGFETSNH